MYHAQNFITKSDSIITELKALGVTETTIVPVSDAIYFEFDAFVISGKSIIEGNIVNRGRHLHPSVVVDFVAYSQEVFKAFIQQYFKYFRNEIVHINNFGSAVGSMVIIESGNYGFRAFGYINLSLIIHVFRSSHKKKTISHLLDINGKVTSRSVSPVLEL